MSNTTDERLIEAIRRNDYVSYNKLFERYYGRLCQYVYSLLMDKSDTEDIVQELFLNIWKNRERIEIKENVGGYLYKMANNPNKQLPESIKVDRAEKIIQTGIEVGFTHTFLSSRFFIDWIISWVLQEYSVDKILECVKESMTDEKAKKLMEECKADNFSDLFDAAIELH